MSWHVDPEALGAYARGESDVAEGFSIEAHLLACDGCKAAVAPMVEPARLDAAWAGIVDRLDAPQLGPVERLLRHAVADRLLARRRGPGPGVRGRRRPSRRSRGAVVRVPRRAVAGGRRRRGVRARARSRLRGRSRRPV